jgi:hypothetical protein
MVSASRGQAAEEGLAKQFIRGQHEASNRRQPERECHGRQDLFRQEDQDRRRALLRALVEQPPEEHGQMYEIQQSTDGCRKCGRRRIGRSDDDLLKYSLYAQA